MKWIKIIILWFLVFTISCKKEYIDITPKQIDVFKSAESSVVNEQEIQFYLEKSAIYNLVISNVDDNQTLTRERFTGQIGINKKKIYTKSLAFKYLYLLLEDENGGVISKTKIIVN